jgi:PTS system nitrogen regulatory IIA component
VDDLSVKDAALMLRVSEDTMLRWIRQGVVPTHKIQGEFRFQRAELESWARRNRMGSQSAPKAPPATEDADLLAALERGGVFHDVAGTTPEAVLRELTRVFPFPRDAEEVPREALLASLLEREALVTTAVGKGIALPHPRHPQDWGLPGPVVGVGFLKQPVDFGALDGLGVTVLFAILCSTVKGHLTMLSQVSHLVHDAAVREFLATRPTAEALLERIRNALPHS